MARLQRRISAASVSQAALEQAASALRALPEKPKEVWSLREAVISLQSSILDALNKGYGYEEVAKMLTNQGVEISASSLKSYLSSAKRQQNNPTERTRRSSRTAKSVEADKLKAIANQGLEASLSDSEATSDSELTAKTPRKAKATASTRTTKSKTTTAKPAAKAQPKSTSTAKPKGTRDRKN